MRTGILAPDWLVIGNEADRIGAAAVVSAGYVISSLMSTAFGDLIGYGMKRCLGFSSGIDEMCYNTANATINNKTVRSMIKVRSRNHSEWDVDTIQCNDKKK